jgi:hypothetical protein
MSRSRAVAVLSLFVVTSIGASCVASLEPTGAAELSLSVPARAQSISAAPGTTEITVGYFTAGGSFVTLGSSSRTQDTSGTRTALRVDLAPCLADDISAGRCALAVRVRLLDALGAAYDSAEVGPITATPGATIEVPPIRFRATARLVALDSVVRLNTGASSSPRVTALDASGQLLVGRALNWRAINAAVASVDGTGRITAVAPGATVIEATREGATAAIAVTVPIVESFTITTPPVRVIATVPAQVTVALAVAPGRSTRVLYRTSNPAVATVDTTGKITTFADGTATLTALAQADTTVRATLAVTVDPFRAVTAWSPNIFTADRGPLLDAVNGIWGSSIDSVVAVVGSCGGSPAISRLTGFTWRIDQSVPFCAVALTGASSRAMWAVGSQIWRYDGTAWTRETVAQTGTLYAASTAGGVTFAVGDNGQIFTRDASGWRQMASGTSARLTAVSALSSTQAYAVGDGGTVLRLANGQWSLVDAGTRVDLLSVLMRSPTEVYIDGRFPFTGVPQPMLRFDGTTWVSSAKQEFSPAFGMCTAGVDAYAVGENGMILRLNNGAWVTDAPQSIGTPLRMCWGDASGAVVGGFYGLSYVKRGGAWTFVNNGRTYQSIWAASSNFIVAGGVRGAIDIFDGTRWASSRDDDLHIVYSVWGTDPRNVWAASIGHFSRFDGTSWQQVAAATNANIYQVWGTARDAVWAVTSAGEILSFDGSSWQVAFRSPASLRAIHGSSARNIYAVGEQGRIWRFDGQSWQQEVSGLPSASLTGVYVADSNNVFVVAGIDLLQRVNGTWRATTPSGGNSFFWITGTSSRDVYAGGCSARVVRYDGVSWASTDPSGATGCRVSGSLFREGGMILGGLSRNIIVGTGPLGNTPGTPR